MRELLIAGFWICAMFGVMSGCLAIITQKDSIRFAALIISALSWVSVIVIVLLQIKESIESRNGKNR